MIGALKYEWKRITTIRSSYWMSAMAIVFTAAITLLLAVTVNSAEVEDLNIPQVTTWILTGGASFVVIPVMAAPFYAVMGGMAMGHEYRYGTNKATLTAIPDRITVLAAKLIILLLWVLATAILTLLLNAFITWAFMDSPNFSSEAWRPVFNYLGYNAGFAIAGFALSAIFRNQTGALVAVLTWPLVIEPIIYGVLTGISEASNSNIGKLTNLLPASAGRRSMFDPYSPEFVGFGASFDVWGLGASTLMFWVGVIIVLVGGCTLFIKRDA